MADQRPLRILCVAPVQKPAPEPDLDFQLLPLPGGGGLVLGEVTPERRRELLELLLAIRPREPDAPSTCITSSAVEVSARALLVGIAARRGNSALHLAGRLYVDHGERARRHLAEAWRPDWPAPRAAIDAHLARAGVVAADVLPGLGGAP